MRLLLLLLLGFSCYTEQQCTHTHTSFPLRAPRPSVRPLKETKEEINSPREKRCCMRGGRRPTEGEEEEEMLRKCRVWKCVCVNPSIVQGA